MDRFYSYSVFKSFFLICIVESKLGPLGTSAIYWPIVPARVIVRMENLVERMAGEAEILGENLPRRHFVHHKSHFTRPGIEPGPPATNRFSYGAAI
jgi:hypothetical protein